VILLGDCLIVLPTLEAASCQLCYIDPPFNTGKARQGLRGSTAAYEDTFEDFPGWLLPRVEAILRCLTPQGTLMVHLDPREAPYVRVALDGLLGRDHFLNEIVWAYDYGGRSRTRWSAKHDTILVYVMDPEHYTFNLAASDRIPYMAPGLVGAEKARLGKLPTDVHWHTIAPTNGPERTGYPTQKPLGLLRRWVAVHSDPGDTVLDAFAGSGTTGAAARLEGRKYILIDENPEAIKVMKERLLEKV